MRWSGPGLAIPFLSNLCLSSSPRRLICTLHELERLDGWYSPQHFAIPELSCHLEHIIKRPYDREDGRHMHARVTPACSK